MANKICLDAIQTTDLVNFLREMAGENNHIPLTSKEVTLRAVNLLKFGIGDKTVPNLLRKLKITCDRSPATNGGGKVADRVSKIERFLATFDEWKNFEIEISEDND